jgi:hypothetical protein
MTIYINGEVVTYEKALGYFCGVNFSYDWVELKAIFDKATKPNGEDQRDYLLSSGIEIIFD